MDQPPANPSLARVTGGAGEVWSIAWPTVLTMTSYTIMQFVDKLMLGQVGPLEVAARGNGGIWAFTPIAVALGFLTVVNTYVSQNLGAGTPERAPPYGWAAIWLSVVFWLVVLLPLAAFMPAVFERLHDPERVVEIDRLVTLVEVVLPAAIFLGPGLNARLRTRAAWRPAIGPMRDLIKIGWPGAVQFGNEILCWSVFMTVLLGRFGEDHLTAGWIALGYMHLSFMPAIGFSVAVTSLVGRYIGAGQPDVAQARARVGLLMAVRYMTVCAIVFLLFRHPLIAAFVGGEDLAAGQAERIIRIGGSLMICAAVFQTLDAVGIVYTGALRGAGDTLWPGLITIIYAWLFLVAGGWLMTERFPSLESIGPWIAAAAYLVVLGVTMAWRFESGRWRSITLLGEPAPGTAPGAGPVGLAPPAAAPDASIGDIAAEIAESNVG